MESETDMEKLAAILPPKVTNHFKHLNMSDVIEITLDMGRLPEIRHAGGRIDCVGNIPILWRDLSFVCEKFPQLKNESFCEVPETLHRIKTAKDSQGKIIGISCSVGRFVTDSIDCISDVATKDKNILYIGRKKSGKTTKLRETAILLSTQMNKNVVVVDPYRDILGESDALHPVLKNVKRVAGNEGDFKKDLMLEAREIYNPDVIIVDEITTRQEIQVIKTLVADGVKVVASVLGTNLESLMKNPILFDMIGGIKTVTFSENEEKEENVLRADRPEFTRIHQPIFDTVIEILSVNMFSIYEDTVEAVDSILQRCPIDPDVRKAGPVNFFDERYKDSNFDVNSKKDVRVKSMKAIIQESFFHGASWMGQNFIA